ncbi:hypothetical protein [Taklimakanibacter deserti]|uniref:hypothetical protein n=1 Tax=Taklimakanibacter deserti TaxID=2267839 RepID=UPI000E654649
MSINLEIRKYWKKQCTRRKDAEPSDVTTAVLNIYQSELGLAFDDEGFVHLRVRIAALAQRHEVSAKNYGHLVDLVLEEMHREDAEVAQPPLH